MDFEELLQATSDEIIRLSQWRMQGLPGRRLEASAFRILRTLARSGPRTLRELESDLQLEQSTVHRQAKTAAAKGLVQFTSNAGRGSRSVEPTDEGLAAYRDDEAVRAALFAEVLSELGQKRAERFIDDLRAFNDACDRLGR